MKLSKIISYLVLLIGVISLFIYYQMAKAGSPEAASGKIDALINITKILFYFGVIAMLVGFVLDIFESKKSAVYTLVSFGLFGVVVLIAYLKASHKTYTLGEKVYSASVSAWTDTGLWAFYILLAIALAAMLVSWITDFIHGDN